MPAKAKWTLCVILLFLSCISLFFTNKIGISKQTTETPHNPSRIDPFNVCDFGAKGDGVHMDNEAIQAAIDACSKNGGGVVFLPNGKYLTATIFLKSNVTLHLARGATLLGSKEIRDYATNVKPCVTVPAFSQCLIYSEDAENIGLTGQGTVDGQGKAFFAAKGKTGVRPMLARFVNCKNLTVRDLTFQNAGSWCMHPVLCDNVKIDAITIKSRDRYNNDGIDLEACQNVFITNCNVSSSDDAITLKNNFKRSCRNIVITNCVISTRWAAFRFGPESKGGFEDITVSNCVIYDTFGAGIKLQLVQGAKMEDITFSNLVMDNVTGPISMRLDSHVGWGSKEPVPTGTFRNVLINNVRARVAKGVEFKWSGDSPPEYNGEQRSCINITGVPGHNIEGITLSNIHITFPGGGTREEADRIEIPENEGAYPEYFMFGVLPSYGLFARHVRGLTLDNVRFDLASPDMRPAIVCEDTEDLDIRGLRADGNPQAESLIRLRQTRQAFIHGCRPTSDIGTFLRVEGEESGGITVVANDLSRVATPVETGDGADGEAVTTTSE